ncbi:hypothetical protein [Candidatus Berkiella aquae]|uniref:Leucine Rich repeats (2 copies) n=1 Tax=Candidatus Berkiella aquae TaxID=295108 RepID=A0AAE3HXF7_9GAMM|nr:hypothetical protein [Candidatus Berkiella aquae]MCS5711531.1 hypothetical protein [Candidatus Berkiella aquae]
MSERCNSLEELKKRITDKNYKAITLNDNTLNDKDLLYLQSLMYLEDLSIAATDITGSCLKDLLHIPGLRKLDISCNESLNLQVTLEVLTEHLPQTHLAELDLSGNPFDCISLVLLISTAFSCAHKGFKRLALGNLEHLEHTQIDLLHQAIQSQTASNPVIIDSPTLRAYEEYLFNPQNMKQLKNPQKPS